MLVKYEITAFMNIVIKKFLRRKQCQRFSFQIYLFYVHEYFAWMHGCATYMWFAALGGQKRAQHPWEL